MKNQYFGDKRDYWKYELLADLTQALPGPHQLTSLLMLTPDDKSGHGNLTIYPLGKNRPGLWKALKESVGTGRRDVTQLRQVFRALGITYNPWQDDVQFHEAGREAYFKGLPREWLRNAVVFLDPDVGLERPSGAPVADLPKYVTVQDLECLLPDVRKGSVVVLYQHLQRNKNLVERDLLERTQRFANALGVKVAWWVKRGDLAFLAAATDPALVWHLETLLMAHAGRHELALGRLEPDESAREVMPASPVPDCASRRVRPTRNAGTTEVGYENRNRQAVIRKTDLPGNDHLQRVYELECGDCRASYGANGSDIHLRRCPRCQGGMPGLAIS